MKSQICCRGECEQCTIGSSRLHVSVLNWDLFQLEFKLRGIFHTRKEAIKPLLDAAVEQRVQAEQVWPEDLGPRPEGKSGWRGLALTEKVPGTDASLAAALPQE